jgi:hypothetical protein
MKVLKWIAVLPVSVLAYALATLIWQVLPLLTAPMHGDPNPLINFIHTNVITPAIAAAAFVCAGTFIAPNYKKATALILTILICMIAGASLFVVNAITEKYLSNIEIVAEIVGSVICCLGIQQIEKEGEIK